VLVQSAMKKSFVSHVIVTSCRFSLNEIAFQKDIKSNKFENGTKVAIFLIGELFTLL